MITEDYVSFETAKLLKEKGFVGSGMIGITCGAYSESAYERGCGIETESGKEVGLVYDDLDNTELANDEYLRPTQAVAMKWLREIKALHIMVDCIGSKNYLPIVQNTGNSHDYKVEAKHSKIGGNGFDSYEQACEAGIKYCLENLV